MSDVSLQAEVVWQSNYESVLRETDDLEQRIDRLSAPINLDLAVDTSRLAELDTLISDQSLDVTIDPVVESDSDLDNLLRLESESIAPEIDPTLNDAPINEVKDLDSEVVTPEVDVQEKNAQDSVLKKLDDLRNLGVIQLTLDLVDRMTPVVGTVLDLISTDAAALLNARTGGSIENAGELIDNVFTSSLATSRDEAAQLLAVAQQLGVPFEELQSAVGGAFDTAIVQGQDVNEVLATANMLVTSGLADNFTSAYDVITAGFQSGANQGDEFLSVLREYGSTFSELGFSAEETLSVIDSGLAGGFDNADRIADAMREMRLRAMNTSNDDVEMAYASLGLGDEQAAFRAGEISGAELWEGLTSALDNLSADQQATYLQRIVGTQSEDFGADALLSVTTANEAFDNLEGRMTQASETFNNTLGQTLTTFWETVNSEAAAFLGSEQLGLAQKVEDIKNGLKDAIGILQEGGTLGEALEVGLKIQGADDFIQDFQSAMGNFVIAILQVVAKLQELIPGGSDGSATRAEIARLAEGQLTFDLRNADTTEIGELVRLAMERGVTEADVGTAVATAINEELAAFDLDQAQALADSAALARATFNASGIGGVGFQSITVEQQAGETLADFEARLIAMRDAYLAQVFGGKAEYIMEPVVDTTESQALIDSVVADLQRDLNTAFMAGDYDLAMDLAEKLNDPGAIAAVQEAATNYNDALVEAIGEGDAIGRMLAEQVDSGDLDVNMQAVSDAVSTTAESVATSSDEMAAAVEDADSRIGTATTGNTITTNLDAVGLSGGNMGKSMQAGALAAANAIDMLDNRLEGSVASILARLATLKTAMADAQNIGGGMTGGPQIDQNYEGGVADGWSWVGERGPELMHFDQSAAILNNQSSMRMLDLLGGGMGGGPVNVYNTWNVSSGAQADAAVTRMLNQLRGLTG